MEERLVCELLGISRSHEGTARFSFTKLRQESKHHPHGWGIAFYQTHPIQKNRYAVIFKEPLRASHSELCLAVRDLNMVRSKIIISHIREASGGSHIPLNTHPFELELDTRKNSGREKSWTFAHNGTIPFKRNIRTGRLDDKHFPLRTFRPHGDTDSEYAFCYIMNNLHDTYLTNGYRLTLSQKVALIEKAANRIDDNYPKSMNFLLSDGYRIYAYYGGLDKSGGLWYLLRRSPHRTLWLVDKSDGQRIVLGRSESGTAAIIATKRLTKSDEVWQNFNTRTVYVFQNGTRIRPTHIN
jgi:glutamine amidotransferase